MGTFVYAPGVRIHIHSGKTGEVIDVTSDITRGSLNLAENSTHGLSFNLLNQNRKYDGVFMPNDRVVVYLRRVTWVLAFSGYLDRVPFASVWPTSVGFTATCTLKKLVHTLYDPGSVAVTTLLQSNIGTLTETDSGLSGLATAALTEIGRWPEDAIHIGLLPGTWWDKVKGLYEQISPYLQETIREPLTTNSPAATGGYAVGTWDADGDMVLTDAEMVQLLYQTGWTDQEDLIRMMGIVWRESRFRIDAYNETAAGNGDHAHGLFQLLLPLHGSDPQRTLSDPAYAASEAFRLWSSVPGGAWNHWYGAADGSEQAPEVQTEGKQRAVAAIAQMGWPPPTSVTPAQTSVPGAADPTGTGTGAGPPTNPAAPSGGAGYYFPAPGGTWDRGSWNQVRAGSNQTSGYDHYHNGVDIMCPIGTPAIAVTSGVVTVRPVSSTAGWFVWLDAPNGDRFKYLHLKDNSIFNPATMQPVGPGGSFTVQAGQQFAQTGDSGSRGSPHLHFEYHPISQRDAPNDRYGQPMTDASPNALLESAIGSSASAVTGAGAAGGGAYPMVGADLYTPMPDPNSEAFIGPRVLLNDIGFTVYDLVSGIITSSMRNFCAAPNGDFISWFPDYFGNYQTTATLTLNEIELLDFTIEWSDSGLVTHQFVTGSITGYGGSPVDGNESLYHMLYTQGIASVEFPEIMEAILGPDAPEWTQMEAMLQRFGARPNAKEIREIISPEMEFYAAIHLFMRNWALQFSTSIQISFMPELWPGMILKIPSAGIQVYVESVTHEWDMQSGFSTTVQVCAPASLGGGFAGLVQAGNLIPRGD